MLAGVSGRAPTVRPEAGTRGWFRRLRWPAAIAAGTVAVFCCALIQARQMGMQSDGASMVLEAWAMSHGNPLLHGWYLADVTFYTTELPEYMLVEAFRGVRPDVVAICAALTYTLLVVLAAALAYQRGPSRRSSVTAAVITVAVMLGPVPVATNTLLNDPDHVGSAVPVLLAFLLAGRALDGRPRTAGQHWPPAAAVAAVLAWSMVGDQLIAVIAIVPLVTVCGGRACWQRVVRRQPLASVAAELSLAVAGLAAAAVGIGLTSLIPAVGGYVTSPLTQQHVVSLSQLWHNVGGIAVNFLTLFSGYLVHPRASAWLAVTVVHLVFGCLVAGALILALVRFPRSDDLVARLLAAGIVANLAGYALLYPVGLGTIREIGPVFGLGAALLGRVLSSPGGTTPGTPRVRARWQKPPSYWARGEGSSLRDRLVVVAAAAAVAVTVPTLLAVVPGTPSAQNVAAFLASHHLRTGLGGYWQSNNITVETGKRVTVLPLRMQQGTGLAPYQWELDGLALQPPAPPANFVVITEPGVHGGAAVTEREAISLFGNPARVYSLPPWYKVLVWRKNLLPHLPRP